MRISLLSVVPAAVLLGLAGCADRSDGPLGPPSPPLAAISDGARGGNGHFFFLPPLVAPPSYEGTFDGTLEPVVEICEWTGAGCVLPLVARLTTSSSLFERVFVLPRSYLANWYTHRYSLVPGRTYRLRVMVAGAELGFADIAVVGRLRELRNVNTDEYIPLLDGFILPIRFRIEIGAVFVIGPDGGTANAADGLVQLVVPPGALATKVGIVVRPVPVTDYPPGLGIIPGTVYDFQPNGLVFAQPVQLTIAFEPANVPTGVPEAALTFLAETAGLWDELPGTTADEAANTISGPIDRFSKKAVATAASITVSPATASLVIGQTVQLTPSVTDAAGTAIIRRVRWSSGDSAVATVDGAGLVTALAAGSATITARAGRAEAQAQIEVAGPSHFMYVANYSAKTVSVYTTPHNTLVATVPVGTAVTGIAVTPDGRFVYATNQLDNTVSVIETTGHTVIATIPVGYYPLGVATSPDGAYAYVANRYSSSVSVIATATQTVVRTISMPDTPFWITVTPDGLTAFVGQDYDSYVSAVNLSTGSVVNIPVGSRPRGIAVTPDGAYAYVANAESNTASVIRTATQSVVATVPVGSHPEDVAITPDGLLAYVAADDWGGGSPNGSLTVIRVADNSVVATIPSLPNAYAVAVDPEGKNVYVTDPGGSRIYVVDRASNTVTGTFSAATSLDLVIARVPIP